MSCESLNKLGRGWRTTTDLFYDREWRKRMRMEDGEARIEDGGWRIEDRGWRMEDYY